MIGVIVVMFEVAIKKRFVKEKIELNCEFSFEKGEFITLYGKNDSGNEKLLNMLEENGRYIHSDTGEHLTIIPLNDFVKYLNKKNIKNNIYAAAGKKNKSFANEILEQLELKKFEKLFPAAVNYRDFQRFIFGMCLAKQPDILTIHKPLNSFSFDLENKLEYFCEKYAMTVISLTDDFKKVPKFASRLLFMHRGEVNKTIMLS